MSKSGHHLSHERDPTLESELSDRMNEIRLLHTQIDMLRRDLEVKESFLNSVPTAHKTPVEALGYEFPIDVGKTSVIGYRAVDDIVRLIRKFPGWSLFSKWAWRNDRYRPEVARLHNLSGCNFRKAARPPRDHSSIIFDAAKSDLCRARYDARWTPFDLVCRTCSRVP